MKQLNLIPKGARRVGLLGGSFNPAHHGHRFISVQILNAFKLDYIIWLVSPQNPLKTLDVRSTLNERLSCAKAVAKHPQIIVSDIEKEFQNSYTITTIKNFKNSYPTIDFMWIMGADNMVQFPKWNGWQEILANMPICVYDRKNFTDLALEGEVTKNYKGKIIKRSYSGKLNAFQWYFLKMKKIDISSTDIRARNMRHAQGE